MPLCGNRSAGRLRCDLAAQSRRFSARRGPCAVRWYHLGRLAAQSDGAGGSVMAYVAVKGGEQAIANAHAWLSETRRGDKTAPEVSLAADQGEPGRAGSTARCALPVRPRAGRTGRETGGDLRYRGRDPLLRAYRTTMPRLGLSCCRSKPRRMAAAAAYLRRPRRPAGWAGAGADLNDYTHRLLDCTRRRGRRIARTEGSAETTPTPRVTDSSITKARSRPTARPTTTPVT